MRVLVSKNTFAGEVRTFAGSSAPTGFLECDGSPVSRTAYPQLFSAIGTAHGNGSQNADGTASGFTDTHFNLPDYRGTFLRGVDGTKGNDPDKETRTAAKTGGNTGNNVGSIQQDQFKSHHHNGGVVVPYYTPNPLAGGNAYMEGQVAGGNETRPKNASVLYCIKY